MIFRIWYCRHDWGFPRRWREFEGERDVDVQRCTRCGAYRRSPVQFGPERAAGEPKALETATEAC